MPGVLLTLTAEDWKRAGHGELKVVHPMPFSDGRPMNEAPRPAFASGKVHHVGDIVAAVVAREPVGGGGRRRGGRRSTTSRLPAVATPRDAVAPGAPLVHERFGTNLVFEIERGDREKTEAAMAAAAKVVELDLDEQPAFRQSDGAALLSLRLRRRAPTASRSMRRASSRTICAAGSPSTRCTFPSTRSA